MSFEGMIDNGDFVTGTILGNNDGIALAGFNNNLKASLYYCGMGNDGIAYGNYDIRYDDEIIKRCPVMIKFVETDKGFDDEIELRSSVAKTKNNLYKEKRIVYEWYKNNRDLEIKRSLEHISSDLHRRLIGSIRNYAMEKRLCLEKWKTM